MEQVSFGKRSASEPLFHFPSPKPHGCGPAPACLLLTLPRNSTVQLKKQLGSQRVRGAQDHLWLFLREDPGGVPAGPPSGLARRPALCGAGGGALELASRRLIRASVTRCTGTVAQGTTSSLRQAVTLHGCCGRKHPASKTTGCSRTTMKRSGEAPGTQPSVDQPVPTSRVTGRGTAHQCLQPGYGCRGHQEL